MPFEYAYLVPILCTVWFSTTFIITYVISVYRKDVPAIFPYVSDAGSWPPESCIFGLAMNIGAIMLFFWVYLRYLHVKYLFNKDTSFAPLVKKSNYISFCAGSLCSFGICIVANFQETNALAVHMVGAIGGFASGCVYQCMQTWISFQLYPYVGNKRNNFAKLFCALISCVTFIVCFTCGSISKAYFKGKDVTKWTKNDGGFPYHLISTVAEWIMAICSISFPVLYTLEIKKMSISEPSMTEKA